MPEHTETSSHPLATAIKQEHQPDTATTNLSSSSTTNNNQPRSLPPSNDLCQDTKRKNSRRRPASTLTAASGPHTGSSRTEQSVTSPSNMSSHAPSVHYTRTGRISKAKKGLKVHDCECGRSYTRAEHLRRHQKNHAQEGAMVCRFPDCGKEFVRLDLLQRHEERHIELGDKSRQNSEPSSRASPTITQHPLPPADVQVFPPTTLASPTYYAPMPVTSVPATPAAPRYTFTAFRTPELPPSIRTSRFSFSARSQFPQSPPTSSPHNKTGRGSVSNAPHVAMPLAVDQSINSPFFDPWSQPPPLSPPSSYAPSPIPVQVEFPNQYSTTYHSHYNDDASRTRSSSVVSHIEPWAATPRSPTSSQTTVPNLWYSEKAASGLAFMDPHYPVTSHGMMSNVDAMAGFGGHYGPKTMIQRDEEEAAYLFGAGEDPYGMGQLAHSFPLEQFLNNYWRLFDPAFPLVHRPSFETMSKSPMLHAAMIAIGGQYSNDMNAKRKSRDLHDRCMKLLEKRDHEAMAEDERLCDYQSVFLIEVLSQYRARRAAKTLSPRFGTLYHKACDNFRHRSLQASEILNLTHQDNISQDSWTEWIDLMTWQHLLSACYVLESQQAILLAREPHSSIFRGSGIDLPLPAHPTLWGANTAQEWTSAAREHSQAGQYLYDITNQAAPVHHTSFLSALLIAANYNHFGLSQPYMDMPPVAEITHLLDPSRSTRYKLLTANLVRVTPIRALLAVSGESWILSEKVTSEETFSDLRFALRTWLRHLWPSTPGTTSAPVKEALGLAIKILQLALSDSANACMLDLGADMGVYFASLVLWGVVASATSRSTSPSARRHSSDPNLTFALPSPPSPPHNPAPSSLTHAQILATAKGFLKIAYALAATDPAAQSVNALTQAQAGCVALLLWVKLRLRGGAAEGCVVGMGELCESVVGSLERVLAHGWKNWDM